MKKSELLARLALLPADADIAVSGDTVQERRAVATSDDAIRLAASARFDIIVAEFLRLGYYCKKQALIHWHLCDGEQVRVMGLAVTGKWVAKNGPLSLLDVDGKAFEAHTLSLISLHARQSRAKSTAPKKARKQLVEDLWNSL